MRNGHHVCVTLLALCAACGDASTESQTREPSPGARATPTRAGDPAAEAPEPTAGRPHLDLLALAHLADVHREGLYIPFGERARWKYTHGRWAPVTQGGEWGRDTMVDRELATPLGASGKVFFHLDRSEAVTIRVRARSLGATKVTAFLGETSLGERPIAAGAVYRELDFTVPAAATRASENVLTLRGDTTADFRGFRASIAIASIRVVPGAPSAGFVAPRDLVTAVEANGVERPVLTLAPGTTIDHYVAVPEGARLEARTSSEGGRGTLTVEVETEAATDATLGRGATPLGEPIAAPATPRRTVRPLDAHAGKIVRLRLAAQGAPVRVEELRVTFAPREASARPRHATAKNVVIVLIDTLRGDRLRMNRASSRVQTPALDAFAAAGANFRSAQAPENWTKPSVASVLTSTYPSTHGAKYDPSMLAPEALMVSEILKRAGFTTGSFIANGFVSDRFGFSQGWDHYTNYIRESRSTRAEAVFGEAADWIEAHKDQRFFAYVHTIDPHVPYDPPDEFLRMYDAEPYTGVVENRRTPTLLEDAKRSPPRVTLGPRDVARIEALYDAEISYHDRHFGRFLERLAALGLADDTIVFVTSDHGEEMNDHGSWGHGHSVFQELLNVPLAVRWPGVVPNGAVHTETVSTIDVVPTALEALGVEAPPELEGHSLLPVLRGEPPIGPAVAFSDFQENRRVIRAGRYKLIVRGNLRSILFDLETDPGERAELDPRTRPIATRYLRILLGQFLGAPDKGRYLFGDERRRVVPQAARAAMTPELCAQLASLGYIISTADCGGSM